MGNSISSNSGYFTSYSQNMSALGLWPVLSPHVGMWQQHFAGSTITAAHNSSTHFSSKVRRPCKVRTSSIMQLRQRQEGTFILLILTSWQSHARQSEWNYGDSEKKTSRALNETASLMKWMGPLAQQHPQTPRTLHHCKTQFPNSLCSVSFDWISNLIILASHLCHVR